MEAILMEIANAELELSKTTDESEREFLTKKIEDLNIELEELEEQDRHCKISKFRGIQYY